MSAEVLHTSVVAVKPTAHRILYTGLDGPRARAHAALWRKAGAEVTYTKRRVLGSKLSDPNPWHYTVIAHGDTQSVIDSILK